MPRKGPAPKRPIIIDPVFGAPVVTQLINKVLLDGKRSVAEAIVYGALEGVAERSGQDPVVVLKRALDNIRPALEVLAAASVARPTRFPWTCAPCAPRPLPCVGSLTSRASVARRP